MRDVSFGSKLRRHPVALVVVLAILCLVAGSAALRTFGSVDAARPAVASLGDVSPAYLYGYTSAALTVCSVTEGPAWGAFERTLADRRAGDSFLTDVSKGFAAFDRDANAHGHPALCNQVLDLYGGGNSDSESLLSSSITRPEAVAPLRVDY